MVLSFLFRAYSRKDFAHCHKVNVSKVWNSFFGPTLHIIQGCLLGQGSGGIVPNGAHIFGFQRGHHIITDVGNAGQDVHHYEVCW